MLTKIKNNWTLLMLIGIHASVLFYDYLSIPFYHDELSAIERCNFDNFGDLINKGILVDGHPAGVQLFICGLVKLFGVHEWILKLPFLFLGLGSLFYLYKISEFLFSKYAAITSSIFFIFLSYYIAQIVVIRPYIPGLFFTLGAFYHAIKIKLHPFRKRRYILLSIFSVGAMYSHYFSFLQCLVAWLIVFIFNYRKIYFKYFIVSIGIPVLLFLPHIFITYNQLGMGGLAWLGKPDLSFFPSFFYTFFNSNYIILGIASVMFILSFFVMKPRKKNKAAMLLLFFLPCLIIFTYSVAIAPVLQAPALFFCTPFLLIFIGNGIDFFRFGLKVIIIIFILLTNIYVLLIANQYYNLRNYQPIENFVVGCKKMVQKQPDVKVLFIWSGNSNYIRYYLKKHIFNDRIIATDTLHDLRKIDLAGYDEIVCNQLSPVQMYELNKSFPYVISMDNNLLYSFIRLSRKKTQETFYRPPVKLIFNFDTGKEWSQSSYNYKLEKLIKDKYRFIEFVPKLDSVVKGAEMVLETYQGGERIDWRSIYLEPGNILSIKIKDVVKDLNPNLSIKLYIWNSAKIYRKPVEVEMFQRADNPWEYNYQQSE